MSIRRLQSKLGSDSRTSRVAHISLKEIQRENGLGSFGQNALEISPL